MPLHERFRRNFNASVTRELPPPAAKSRIRDVSFFRSAMTANVVENERRSFLPLLMFDGNGLVTRWRCSCAEDLKPGDLCRHLGLLLFHTTDADGSVITDRFESSIWRAIGVALFE